VLDEKTGFVVSYDAEAMAARIRQLVDDSVLRRELGARAQEWIRRRFNWHQMASAYSEVFLEIAERQAGRRHALPNIERN
jgi:glycosyltransferase involved in cell wall biosynthesis